jgi:hypothetical protein
MLCLVSLTWESQRNFRSLKCPEIVPSFTAVFSAQLQPLANGVAGLALVRASLDRLDKDRVES